METFIFLGIDSESLKAYFKLKNWKQNFFHRWDFLKS